MTERPYLRWDFIFLIQNPKNWIMEASEHVKAEAVYDSNAVMHFCVLTLSSKIFFLGGTCEQ